MSVTTSPGSQVTRQRRSASDRRRHETAVVQAEARRLALALAPFRVLSKPALARVARTARWREGGYDRALNAAVRAGMIERLPTGFYREGRNSRLR